MGRWYCKLSHARKAGHCLWHPRGDRERIGHEAVAEKLNNAVMNKADKKLPSLVIHSLFGQFAKHWRRNQTERNNNDPECVSCVAVTRRECVEHVTVWVVHIDHWRTWTSTKGRQWNRPRYEIPGTRSYREMYPSTGNLCSQFFLFSSLISLCSYSFCAGQILFLLSLMVAVFDPSGKVFLQFSRVWFVMSTLFIKKRTFNHCGRSKAWNSTHHGRYVFQTAFFSWEMSKTVTATCTWTPTCTSPHTYTHAYTRTHTYECTYSCACVSLCFLLCGAVSCRVLRLVVGWLGGVVWCGVVWCGVVWCGVVWCGVVWCGVVWCGVVWCGVVWCGVVWCGVVWCGVVWCGVVWCGVVWCGVVWCVVVDMSLSWWSLSLCRGPCHCVVIGWHTGAWCRYTRGRVECTRHTTHKGLSTRHTTTAYAATFFSGIDSA